VLLQQALQCPNLPLATWATSLLLATGCGRCCTSTATAAATEATEEAALAEPQSIAGQLLLAWSQGLHSPNMSLKLLAASVTSSVLQELAFGGPRGASPVPDLQEAARCLIKLPLCRLSALAVARIYKERAALPICSRYLQGLIELAATVSAVSEAMNFAGTGTSSSSSNSAVPRLLQAQKLQGDSSMPRPLPAQRSTTSTTSSTTAATTTAAAAASCSREWDEAFVLSDAGWTVWSGRVTIAPTRWQHPPHTAALLSSGLGPDAGGAEGTGDAPPLLLPGCKVIRGPDWTPGLYPEPRSSSVEANTNTTGTSTTAAGGGDAARTGAGTESIGTNTASAAGSAEQSDAPVAAPTTAPASPDLDGGVHAAASTPATAAATSTPTAAVAAAEESSRDSRTEQAGSFVSSLSSSSSSLEEETGSSTVQAATPPPTTTAAAASAVPQQEAVHSKYQQSSLTQ
jgi:hypothetical protein